MNLWIQTYMEAKTCHEDNFFKIENNFQNWEKTSESKKKKSKSRKGFQNCETEVQVVKRKKNFFKMLIQNIFVNERKAFSNSEKNLESVLKVNARIQNYRYDGIVQKKILRMIHM